MHGPISAIKSIVNAMTVVTIVVVDTVIVEAVIVDTVVIMDVAETAGVAACSNKPSGSGPGQVAVTMLQLYPIEARTARQTNQ